MFAVSSVVIYFYAPVVEKTLANKKLVGSTCVFVYGRSPFVGATENHQDDPLNVYRVKISKRGRGFAKRGRGFAKRGRGGAEVEPMWGRVGDPPPSPGGRGGGEG